MPCHALCLPLSTLLGTCSLARNCTVWPDQVHPCLLGLSQGRGGTTPVLGDACNQRWEGKTHTRTRSLSLSLLPYQTRPDLTHTKHRSHRPTNTPTPPSPTHTHTHAFLPSATGLHHTPRTLAPSPPLLPSPRLCTYIYQPWPPLARARASFPPLPFNNNIKTISNTTIVNESHLVTVRYSRQLCQPAYTHNTSFDPSSLVRSGQEIQVTCHPTRLYCFLPTRYVTVTHLAPLAPHPPPT